MKQNMCKNKLNASLFLLSAVFDEALKGGFGSADGFLELWICYCDYHRRRIADWTYGEKLL